VKLSLIAVGTRAPGWVSEGFEEYARRMPGEHRLTLVEVAPAARKGWAPERIRADEAARLLARTGPRDRVVALDVAGKRLSTPDLADCLERWRSEGDDVSFLIGGADGLHQDCLTRAGDVISLSALTFPHFLVRIILAEQLYRAWTLLQGHPYHRG
jgi:23S rRNA (pseudouridine1915-N3)-methyltransferase